ncbi:MAG: hypothetical protein KAR38_02240, partial [Calditrichia bacterium]|nr:hypothetical protein [Calditrichia bacterium]
MINCKKTILMVLLLFSFSYSQLIKDYGLKLGMTHSKQDFKIKKMFFGGSPYAKKGFFAGIYLESNKIGPISLVSEINYLQKGSRDKFIKTDENGLDDGYYYLNDILEYLQINLAIKAEWEVLGLPVYIFGGPILNYLITGAGYYHIFMQDEDKTNFGYIIGGGIGLEKYLKKPINLEVVYNPDLDYAYE